MGPVHNKARFQLDKTEQKTAKIFFLKTISFKAMKTTRYQLKRSKSFVFNIIYNGGH